MGDRLIDTIYSPHDLKTLQVADLARLAEEIREEIIKTVSQTGGHLAPSLGAVEIAIALHYVLETPHDVILWDVGHQAYAHKILTGRLKRFATLRQLGGISGFPNKDESVYDIVTSGHSSTSISVGLGLALSRDLKKESKKIVAVIGDASLAGGMAFEALNHAGQLKRDLIIILNDNEFSISPAVGALSGYLNRVLTNPIYNKVHKDVDRLIQRVPRLGFRAYRAARRLERGLKELLIPGILFEELGIRYFGPIDGNNVAQLVSTLSNLTRLREPILIHAVTKKGKGYRFAEENPARFHGTGPFERDTGKKISTPGSRAETFTDAFGEKIVELADSDPDIVAITAAMPDGTGLDRFAVRYPERFFDVGIAEEHAVGLAGGAALGGSRPVVAIYSTFLQRGYDQIIHDVCLQNLPVVFCIDRAGLVGEDGPTHHGLFDIPYLRHIPAMTILAPKSPDELKEMLEFALSLRQPVAIRYPRGSLIFQREMPVAPIEYGKVEVLKEGKDLAIFAVGSMVEHAVEIHERLAHKRVHATIVNARFIRPLDGAFIETLLTKTKRIVTMEEGCVEGGFGSALMEFLEREGLLAGLTVKVIGLPSAFIEHGKREELFLKYNLTPDAICDVIMREVMRQP